MMRKLMMMVSVFVILASVLGLSFTPASAQGTYINYTVQKNDTLGKIAKEYCTTWQTIYDLNRDTIGKNPNVIRPGMVLLVPVYCGGAVQLPEGTIVDKGPMARATGFYSAPYYTVAWGDNLYSIGLRFSTAWQEIAKTNGITGSVIYPNQVLLIPGAVAGAKPPPVNQGTTDRVNFQPGSISASLTGVINQGASKSFILWARSGQALTVSTVSHGEPLRVSIGNARGDLLPLIGVNSQINNSVSAVLPESTDFIVTVSPIGGTENPQVLFDIIFTVR